MADSPYFVATNLPEFDRRGGSRRAGRLRSARNRGQR